MRKARGDPLPKEPSMLDTMLDVDYVPDGIKLPPPWASLIIREDNNAVIKMNIEGRSPNLRRVPGVFRVDQEWVFEDRRSLGIFIEYINTKLQLADPFTKDSFKAASWPKLMPITVATARPTFIFKENRGH